MYKLIVLSLLILVSCATPKQMYATGGSEADGVVNLSYSYGMFEKPVVDYKEAHLTAKRKCQAWNYGNAEPFGGENTGCQSYNGYGNCVGWVVTVPFQCTGRVKSKS